METSGRVREKGGVGHLCDEAGASERDNASHFHRVPTRSPPHHVTVEGVQNALVGELWGDGGAWECHKKAGVQAMRRGRTCRESYKVTLAFAASASSLFPHFSAAASFPVHVCVRV